MLLKLALIFFCLLFLVCIWLGRKERDREPLQGEKITVEDVVILLKALDLSVEDLSFHNDESSWSVYLTYGQYIEIYEKLNGADMNLSDHKDKYKEEQEVLKEDWYAAYRLMLAHLDTESSIWETTVFLMKLDTESGQAYTDNGGMESPYRYHSSSFEQNVLQQLRVYVKGDDLLTVCEILRQDYVLNNVWVMEATDNVLECFYHQITFRVKTDTPVERESVADLTFRDGKLTDVREKTEKIHGKLLRVTGDELEIEGQGVYPISEDMEVYKLYGSLRTMDRADLRIGYADTDFVVYEGKVCAGLISGEEADRIRVLLKNTVHNSDHHEEVQLVVDGETIQVRAEDLQIGERRIYQCAALTDKVLVHTEGIVKEDHAYRGAIECYRTTDGMVLINELPLEEYLYAVVPSEMPASYPLEALKAQAVCARTYAYQNIMKAGLPEVGAHVDDTTSYQVYHNGSENAASTTAVKETSGILLTWQGEPAQNYYYSTSCGVGTNAGIWKSREAGDIPYLQAVRLKQPENMNGESNGTQQEQTADREVSEQDEMITTMAATDKTTVAIAAETGTQTPDDLKDEDTFYRFITSKNDKDLEKEEPWYRWSYTVEKLDAKAMTARIQARYAASPQSILTKAQGDYYVSQPVEELGRIRDLSVARRGAGGVAEELLIETDTGSYKVVSEYNIRSVLCDGISEVVRQDESTTVPKTLLPSGFFVLETGKEEGNVIGYTLTGGGYGHGVGMSQNGARALGREGASYRVILEYFFKGCELERLDQE